MNLSLKSNLPRSCGSDGKEGLLLPDCIFVLSLFSLSGPAATLSTLHSSEAGGYTNCNSCSICALCWHVMTAVCIWWLSAALTSAAVSVGKVSVGVNRLLSGWCVRCHVSSHHVGKRWEPTEVSFQPSDSRGLLVEKRYQAIGYF